MVWLQEFVRESNRIEGINRILEHEVEGHRAFLSSDATTEDIEMFIDVCVPGHRLRENLGMNVTVGNHTPPAGGPEVRGRLKEILFHAVENCDSTPFRTHCLYEKLHPFTDGNGRSGRALWLWMMINQQANGEEMVKDLGFLHCFYYQTLTAQP